MKEFFGDSIIQILQTGFVGVAVLLMYMGYRLLDRNIESDATPEVLRINRTSIFGFLGCSLIVMLGALYITVFPPVGKVLVNMEIYPKLPARIDMVHLRVGGKRQAVPKADSADDQMGLVQGMELRHDNQVTIDLTHVETHISKLGVAQDTLQSEKDALLNEIEKFKEKTAEDALISRGSVVSDEILDEESGA